MERRWDKVEAGRMSRATEGVALGVVQKLGKSAKRFSIKDERCARARPRALSRRVCGPFRSEAALLDQQDSRSIRLVHAWAWWVDETRNCVF